MLKKLLAKKISLKPDEPIENIVRRSARYFFIQGFIAVVLLLLAFFLIYPLFNRGWPGLLVFCLLAMIGLFLAIRVYWNYYFTALVLTSRRLIDIEQSGFSNYFITSAVYGKIQDISFKKRLFSPGEVIISLSGERGTAIRLSGISRPEKLTAEILNCQDNCHSRKSNYTGTRANILLKRIRRRLGEEKFRKLIAD